MEDLLIDTLSMFGYPVMLQGSLLPNEPYPDDFFTFWNNSSRDGTHYDNAAASVLYRYEVNFYSNNPANVYSVLRAAITKLHAAGFIISGDGYSVASDEPTHDGRGVDVMYLRRF